MSRLAVVVIVGLLAGACGSGEVEVGAPVDTPQLMAVALEELVTNDNTFGQGPPPFTEYLIQTSIDLSAGAAGESSGVEARALTTEERTAIEEAIRSYGPVRWIDDFDEWITDDLTPTVEGAVILGVGEPVIGETSVLLPVSLWCGGLCGTWFTYRLEIVDGEWAVIGKEGPIAVS